MSDVEVIQGRPEEPRPVYDKLINRPASITEHLQLIISIETSERLSSADHLKDSSFN